MFRHTLVALLLCAPAHGASNNDAPYALLREAYAAFDAKRASQAYAPNAVYAENQTGGVPVIRMGRDEIASGFAAFFAGVDQTKLSVNLQPRLLDINFRFSERASSGDIGFYRIRLGAAGALDSQNFYGGFATRIARAQFVADLSVDATLKDFESAPGSVLFAADNERLDAAYYDQFLGTWREQPFSDIVRSASGRPACNILITRSARRLFALDECTGQWRGLQRVSGTTWRAGSTLIAEATLGAQSTTYQFTFDGQVPALLQVSGRPARYTRERQVHEPALFAHGSITLSGTLDFPSNRRAKMPAFVLVHGSGEQDRHGYASIVELLAQRLTRAGFVVLRFDKRGAGASDGDWNQAGFDELAGDVRAAMKLLSQRADIDSNRIALAGSSQAGWVIAKSIEQGAKPYAVLLLSAAGTAFTVTEQNLFNTDVRMACSGLTPAAIAAGLAQQRAFFEAKRDPAKQTELTRLSLVAAQFAELRDWVFPSTTSAASREWYDVLDLNFDPRRIWRRYEGRQLFLFGSLDDSTDTFRAIERLAQLPKNPRRQVISIQGAQHLGLAANSVCDSMESRTRFAPELFLGFDRWAVALRRK
jgi:alpha-beta hydrolase superfamily lysophospholipase